MTFIISGRNFAKLGEILIIGGRRIAKLGEILIIGGRRIAKLGEILIIFFLNVLTPYDDINYIFLNFDIRNNHIYIYLLS